MSGNDPARTGTPRVAVVGAGITGLAVTHALRSRDIDVVTFESASRPGGVIRSERVDGRVLEYGPQRLRLTDQLRDIVDELSLQDRLLHADPAAPLYILDDGRLAEVPRTVSGFLRTDLLSIPGKLRVLAEPLTRTGRESETAGDLLRRKFGEEAYRNLIEPLLSGIYASDPRSMPAEHAVRPLLDLEQREGSLLLAGLNRLRSANERSPVVSFDEGLATLSRALAEAHEDAIRFAEPVETIDRRDGAIHIVSSTTDMVADAVVLTTPAWVAADLLSGMINARADPLQDLRYNPLAVVHLLADTDVAGFGYQVCRGEPLETLGVTWNDALFGRSGLHTAFLGGSWHPEVVTESPETIGATARHEFERVMDRTADVLDVTRMERAIPAYDRTWRHLTEVAIPDGVFLATNYTGRIGVSGRLREAERVASRIDEDLHDGKRL